MCSCIRLLANRAVGIGDLSNIWQTEAFGQLGMPKCTKSWLESISHSVRLDSFPTSDELVPETVRQVRNEHGHNILP